MSLTLLDQGSFTSDGTAQDISLQGGADYMVVTNLTQAATTQSTGRGIKFEWWKDLTSDGYAIMTTKQDSSNAVDVEQITSGGFTYVTSRPEPEAAVTGGTISKASEAVVTITNTYSEGDTVILYGTTGMLQISGMAFTISSVSGSGFTLSGLDSSGFATTASAATARRVPQYLAESPQYYYVTKVSKASSAVVTLSQAHNYVVGQLVHFSVPSDFGMEQLDQVTGKITAVGTYTITVDVNSTGFDTFAFPASSASPSARLFATVAPAGARGSSNPISPFQPSYDYPYMNLPAGADSPAGSSGDVIVWSAWRKGN